jgi:hypothetical protein
VTLPHVSQKFLQTLSQELYVLTQLSETLRGARRADPAQEQGTDIYRELWTSVMLPIISDLGLQVRLLGFSEISGLKVTFRELRRDIVPG